MCSVCTTQGCNSNLGTPDPRKKPSRVLHEDILSWLPPGLRPRIMSLKGQALRSAILDPGLRLDLGASPEGVFRFGNCHVAGPPCVDFSPMGAGKREQGPTMACFYVWARGVRDAAPALLIIENVPRFPISLIRSLFADMYAIDFIILDAVDLGAPARRRRLYVVLTLRGRLVLTRSLAELREHIARILVVRRPWTDVFFLTGPDDGFSTSVARRASGYVRVFGDELGVYDLDQLPEGRPRYAKHGAPLFGLTAHTRMVWSPKLGRCMRRSELAAAMGLPAHPALGCTYGMHPLFFDNLSRSAAARLIGNGMCVPCREHPCVVRVVLQTGCE